MARHIEDRPRGSKMYQCHNEEIKQSTSLSINLTKNKPYFEIFISLNVSSIFLQFLASDLPIICCISLCVCLMSESSSGCVSNNGLCPIFIEKHRNHPVKKDWVILYRNHSESFTKELSYLLLVTQSTS